MPTSVFDLFKQGVGPSSSHTMGPMTAACRFAGALADDGLLTRTARVEVELYGSLAATGIGHGTDTAVQLGLCGHDPRNIDPEIMAPTLAAIAATGTMQLAGTHPVGFVGKTHIQFNRRQRVPFHSNALRLTAYDAMSDMLLSRMYFSVGGGFVLDETQASRNTPDDDLAVPYGFTNAAELLGMAATHDMSIAQIMRCNERVARSDAEIDAGLDGLWQAMNSCIERGMAQSGILPGGLNVPRRAKRIHDHLRAHPELLISDPLAAMDFVNVWALAVNEENAGGGRVVTAPTNGAAGIIPAVIRYYVMLRGGTAAGVREFLLTAAAVGALYKRNASISGAEVGCQGEVGVASSMAAAGLTSVMGGSVAQIENAAEIAMEHNLGLTCDPIGGLVQIPCIERNAMGAIKAIDASRLALLGDGTHHVSLDRVIATMRDTGADMKAKYKETSKGGLAVNMVAC